jgi:hypothetical protein
LFHVLQEMVGDSGAFQCPHGLQRSLVDLLAALASLDEAWGSREPHRKSHAAYGTSPNAQRKRLPCAKVCTVLPRVLPVPLAPPLRFPLPFAILLLTVASRVTPVSFKPSDCSHLCCKNRTHPLPAYGSLLWRRTWNPNLRTKVSYTLSRQLHPRDPALAVMFVFYASPWLG